MVTMLGTIQDNITPGTTEDDKVYEIMLPHRIGANVGQWNSLVYDEDNIK